MEVAVAVMAARIIVWLRCPFNIRRRWHTAGRVLWVVDRLQETVQRCRLVGAGGILWNVHETTFVRSQDAVVSLQAGKHCATLRDMQCDHAWCVAHSRTKWKFPASAPLTNEGCSQGYVLNNGSGRCRRRNPAT